MVQAHLGLELIERRITQERCPGFEDPCEVADVPRDRLRQIRRDGRDDGREERYRAVARAQQVPAFWPRRPWDPPPMGDAQSQRLAQQIAALERPEQAKGADGGRRPHAKKGRAKGKAQAPADARKFPFSVSKLDFATDNFEEATDIEWD
jgi:hypothetical protein